MMDQRKEIRREEPRRNDPRRIPGATGIAGAESGEIRDIMVKVKEAWKSVLDRRGGDRRQNERRVLMRRNNEMQPES